MPAAPQRYPSAASLINAPHAPGAAQSALPPTGQSIPRKPHLLKSKWDSYLDECVPLQPSVVSHTLELAPTGKAPKPAHQKWPSQRSSLLLPTGSHSPSEQAPLQGGGAHVSYAHREAGGHAPKRLKHATPFGIHGQGCPDNSLGCPDPPKSLGTLDASHPVHLEHLRAQLSSCSVCVVSIQHTCTQESSEPQQHAGKQALHLGVMCFPEGTQTEMLASLPVFSVDLGAHRRTYYKPAIESLAHLLFNSNSKAPRQQQGLCSKPLFLASNARCLVHTLLPYSGTPYWALAPPMVVDPRVLACMLSNQASLDVDSLPGSVKTTAGTSDISPLHRLREDCLHCVRLTHICGALLSARIPPKAVKEAMRVELLPALDATSLPRPVSA
ncbi:hypothetical protein DUNSADRAFT_7195 [Dunaliella salina]|uniref:Uncharacterized protein n=1 Tax=Dunaliella salina TaxID=3046 RepID=A0ABQ7GLV3_DUNSA|nr:hypothetical protein DUNSADRAFT_7195 [Dunaliella salina]|eukprot:KAF5835593.1 hypothetical protein DUNSADRAFT_7195 [Dunaliella salina]